MFSNIGGKIKGYARIIFTIMVIIGIINAFVWGISLGRATNGFVGFLVIVALIAVFALISYISVMLIYGFGELIENSTRTRELTNHIFDITYNIYSEVYDQNEKLDKGAKVTKVG